MWEILDNEMKRQDDMDLRYKGLDEEQYKIIEDPLDDTPLEKVERNEERDEAELRTLEDQYLIDKQAIVEEIIIDEEEII